MRKTFIRSIIAAGLLFTTAATTNAQIGISSEYVEPRGWSMGTSIGLLDLWGDVGTKSILDHYDNSEYTKKPCFMGGLFFRYSAHPSFAFRIGGYYGTLYATDMWNKSKAQTAANIEDDSYQRYLRNQSIRANTWEGSFLFEIAPLRFNPESRSAMRRFQPLLLLGVAGMHFKPQAEYIDRNYVNRGYVDLYDLNVEGTGLSSGIYKGAPPKYSLWQIVVPAGLGVRWDIGKRLSLGVEWLYRYTFTDYLDNVSGDYVDPAMYSKYLTPEKAALAKEMQDKTWLINKHLPSHSAGEKRGNSSNNDSYSTFGLTLIFKIPGKKVPWWY